MKDWEQEVLSQYDIDVQNKRKVRSGILCEGESGTFLMAQTRLSETRLSMLEQLEMHLLDSGIADVDHLVRNKEGELYCELEDETRCIVKTWFAGRECDVKKENELLNATKNLTRIHKALRRPVSWKEPEAKAHQGEDLNQIFFRHNRELKKVRTFARERVDKGVFEQEFLKNFDSMYIWAEAAAEKLKGSSYKNLERHLIHGDYNYHNILMLYDGVATTNFEHFEENIQMTDFYYFLRKAMEKQVAEVNGIYMTMRGWRHDYHNHLQKLSAHLQEGQIEEAKKYIGELGESLDNIKTKYQTGNGIKALMMIKRQ